MRIAIVSPAVLGHGKSPETYSSQQLNLALRWVEDGHRVDLLTLAGQGLDGVVLHPNMRVCVCPGAVIGKWGPSVMYGVKGALKGREYGFVLASEHYQPATAAACLASGSVLIYQGQNTPGASLKNRALMRLLEGTFGRVSRSRCLGVVAKTQLAARLVEERGFSPVRVIPCGYDESRFYPPTAAQRGDCRASLDLSPGDCALVYAGNLLPRRDVGTAIGAVSDLRRKGKNVRLFIVGDGPEMEVLTRQTGDLGLNNEVVFLGVLPWMRLRELYWAGDLFVFPAQYEIFGLVLLEAMACGLLVVSTPVGAAADIISHGGNGLTMPIGDARALARTIAGIMDDPEAAGSMRRRARRDVEDFTWRAIAQRLVEFAEELGA